MQAVFTTNLKCQSCVGKVRSILDEEPTIESWDADLADPRKILRVELDDAGDPERVIECVEKVGFSASLLIQDVPARQAPTQNSTYRISTYKPLLLVVAYVLGATLFTESVHGVFVWQRAMSYFMGFFFLGFAFFKLLNITGFADAFATYDIVARRSRGYAILYPWIEVTLGSLFLTQVFLVAANVVTAMIMAVGLVGVISAVSRKQAIQCACLGTVFNLPMSFVTIVENGIMISMAAIMLFSEYFD